MYGATRKVFEYICDHCSKDRSHAEACATYKKLVSVKFLFILHLMLESMRITNVLCQNFRKRYQDILIALRLVSTTK